jgi:predicted nucleic acid-binding Zn ribbon protein
MSATPTTEPTRTCPFCAETISAAAKLCPRCRQWLSWHSLRNPAVSASVMGCTVLVCFFVMVWAILRTLDHAFNPPPYYTEFPNALQILESRMNWVSTKDGPRIYVTGTLTNQSPLAWTSLEFDCRFFDAQGRMVDAANARGGLTIRSNDDSAFRAVVLPATDSNEYRAFKISVSTARNTKGRF